jgi:hypothetical protein
MVPNPRHAVVSRENIARLLVSVKLSHELLCLADDVIDDADVAHVFLAAEIWKYTSYIAGAYNTFE